MAVGESPDRLAARALEVVVQGRIPRDDEPPVVQGEMDDTPLQRAGPEGHWWPLKLVHMRPVRFLAVRRISGSWPDLDVVTGL